EDGSSARRTPCFERQGFQKERPAFLRENRVLSFYRRVLEAVAVGGVTSIVAELFDQGIVGGRFAEIGAAEVDAAQHANGIDYLGLNIRTLRLGLDLEKKIFAASARDGSRRSADLENQRLGSVGPEG